MTTGGSMNYNRYRVRRNTTEPGFVFEARNNRVDQVLLIPGLRKNAFSLSLRLLEPYSPRLAANFMEPAGSLYTDDSRTTQVTALGNRIRSFTNFVTGQPHGVASSDAKSPLWNQLTIGGVNVRGADFDGGDDCLQVSGFDMSNTNKVCVIAGMRKLSDAAAGIVCEQTASIGNPGSFNLRTPRITAEQSFSTEAGGTSHPQAAITSGLAAPITMHVVMRSNISTPLLQLNVNAHSSSSSATQGTGNFANSTLNIGGRNNAISLPFGGLLSYLFICGEIPPDAVLTQVYNQLAPRIGLPL